MTRQWTFERSDGVSVNLSERENLWVAQGSTGLDMPPYDFATQKSPGVDGQQLLAVRAAPRALNIPINISGTSRDEYRQRVAELGAALDPNIYGSGKLTVSDPDKDISRFLQCYYSDGLIGDDAEEDEDKTYRRAVISFLSEDPYWQDSEVTQMVWGGSGTTNLFFPIFPIQLGATQLASGSGITYTNLITNPSGEISPAVSVLGYPATATMDATTAAFGTKSTRITLTSPSNVRADFNYYTPLDDMEVGTTYMFSAYINVPSGIPPVSLVVLDGGNTFGVNGIVGNGQWQRIVFFHTMQSTGCDFYVSMVGGLAGQFFNVDGIMVTEADHEITYIDGDQPNSTWNGTPHNSTSFRDPAYEPTPMFIKGDVPTYPIWRFTGPATEFDVTNELGQKFAVTYNLPANRVITVDTRQGMQNVTLDDGTTLWRYLDPGSLFPLHPGQNYVAARMLNTGDESQMSVEYSSRYRMVSG